MKEKQVEFGDYIKVYDNVVIPELCQKLLNLFDLCKKTIYDDDHKKFSEINVNDNSTFFPEFNRIINIFAQCAEAYRRDAPGTILMPPTMIMESIRIKKYQPGGYYKNHIDARDANTMMRYLSMFIFLSDNGGIQFFNNKIQAEQGKVVCFPSNWMFPYNEYADDKIHYSMKSYLHFELPDVKKAREKRLMQDSDE